MEVKVTKSELDMLYEIMVDVKKEFRMAIRSDNSESILVIVDVEVADEIREAAGNYLPIVGFDEDYVANDKGIILENLIDKLFTG